MSDMFETNLKLIGQIGDDWMSDMFKTNLKLIGQIGDD